MRPYLLLKSKIQSTGEIYFNKDILKDAKKDIVVTGLCSKEMSERLRKAEVKNIKEISNIKDAVKYILYWYVKDIFGYSINHDVSDDVNKYIFNNLKYNEDGTIWSNKRNIVK